MVRKTKEGAKLKLIKAIFFENVADSSMHNSNVSTYATYTFSAISSIYPTQGVFFGKLAFGSFIMTFICSMLRIFLASNPFKILYRIICSITIFMINLRFVFRVRYKCFRDHTVDISENSIAFTPTAVDPDVTVVTAMSYCRKECTSWSKYVTKSTNFISRVFGPLAPSLSIHNMVYKPKIEKLQGVI